MRAYSRGLISAVAWGLVMDVLYRVLAGRWLTLLALASTIAVWGLVSLCSSLVRHARAGRRPGGA
jgi:uncharacterized membrane protein YccF (DUF307 family)